MNKIPTNNQEDIGLKIKNWKKNNKNQKKKIKKYGVMRYCYFEFEHVSFHLFFMNFGTQENEKMEEDEKQTQTQTQVQPTKQKKAKKFQSRKPSQKSEKAPKPKQMEQTVTEEKQTESMENDEDNEVSTKSVRFKRRDVRQESLLLNNDDF